MVKVERKKDLLKWFLFSRIKNDISYSTLLKKTGGNGKGYLDRYFVLHRNYIIYYKPGKTDSKPEDNQEPQGYINLGECVYEETKNLSKTQPLTFQITTKIGRVYYIKAKDDKTIETFLFLIRSRIQTLSNLTIQSLGNTEENLKNISNLLPRSMKLPDRVKPDSATKWIMEMSSYYESYREWEPYLMKLDQFSELCHGETKEYVDWFVGSEGPRLSMIRCEELVLENWNEFIKKTNSEINTYEETRFFNEDFQDIIKHLKNMVLLIDSYNLYMRQCHHKTVKYVDKYLEEKSYFVQQLDKYSKMPTMSSIHFGSHLEQVQGTIKGTYFTTTHQENDIDSKTNSEQEQTSSNGIVESREKYEEWKFSENCLINVDNEEKGQEHWRFSNGFFRNERLGDVMWNNKTWVWSHPKTDYKIRFDWDSVSNSFVYFQPRTTASISISLHGSQSKLSFSKKPHPTTVYADWRLSKNNILLHSVVIGNKSKPMFIDLEVQGIVPLPAMLIVAMSYHIKEALEHFNLLSPTQK
ncbi:cytosolic regulator of adenylyl cyclase [Tieghemostelium lacteum]|uniref:Cytosolic regulator of adenylyl cyclase n=1 Tax=Tieghemostelium lacteum TaxID=361077 RepID=A0A151Z3S5_TIELA|nr:cytosolic regulator of adenylyl cyclase [Tieghemostelium lacteum]|eukprot:KYQ88598.1 cytosolic regulator of adenylyl cyclase [Tieghemostelium lacteum]